MFVRNTTDKEIGTITYEGYEFTIPTGVSAIHTPAGRSFLDNNFNPKGEFGGMPPLIEAERSEWDGKRYATVTRFQINSKLIPNRQDLIRIARERGIADQRINEYNVDDTIENDTIVNEINKLPVEEEVRFPEEAQVPTENTEDDTQN